MAVAQAAASAADQDFATKEMVMSTGATDEPGPVLFAYDGSELAGHAITEAGRQLRAGRDALVLTIWEPFNVGFLPVGGTWFDAAGPDEVRAAAEKTAAQGAALAKEAGFQATTMTAEAAPTWKGIIDVADSRNASVIVLGSHGRNGVTGLVVGSVAAAVAAHSRRSVLIVHRRS
jgi:nucleotide-binding universal stress UspA family protein